MTRVSRIGPSFRLMILSLYACVVPFLRDVRAEGRLLVSPERIDFGDRGQMERPSATLTLSNDGDTDLEVLEMKPSCSCIQVRPGRLSRPIPPGGALKVRVLMGSGRAIGSLSKYIAIRTDGVPALTRVPTRLSVFDGLRQEPRDIHFEGVVGGQPVARSVDLLWPARFAGGGAGFSLELAEITRKFRREGVPSKLDRFFSHHIEDIPDGKRLHLSLLPGYPEGRISAALRLRLDEKTLEIPLRGEVFRGIVISPTSINFNRVDPNDGDSFVEETRFVSVDGRAFSITGTTVTASKRTKIPGLDLDITTEPNAARTEWTLRARIRLAAAALPRGSFSGKLLVETDHPEKPGLQLGFFGFFRARDEASGDRPGSSRAATRR